VALAGPHGSAAQKKNYFGEREVVRWQATQTALDMLRRALAAEQPSSSRVSTTVSSAAP
jgi:hypothetical protein